MSTFTDKAQSKLFKKHFAFFAFTKRQFEDAVNPNFKYANMGSGLIVPVEYAEKVINGLDAIHKQSIAHMQARKSNTEIIWDELANYETQITGDLTNAIEVLIKYPGITEELIRAEFSDYYQHCVNNDYF